jgi:outer membrane protein assembly factor BamB
MEEPMKRNLMIVAIAVAGACIAFADGGGMGGMGSGGMMGGSAMLVIADDGSVLVTEMGMGGGMMGGSDDLERELINIDTDGNERWRVSIEDGWPMMPATDGDLVVLTVAVDWWMASGGVGDGGWGHGSGKTLDEGDGHATLVAFDLANGQEQWRLELEGDMLSVPKFTDDGSRLYLTVRDMDDDHVGGGPMRQGDAAGSGTMMTSTLVAVDRSGNVLWTLDLDDDHMGGGGA